MGVHGGVVWKYLLYAVTFSFIASVCSITYTISKGLNYYYYDIFVKLSWIEGYLWTLSECGYVIINYIKIKPFIKELRKKRWKYIMIGVLIYSLILRTELIYLDYSKRVGEYKTGKKIDINAKKNPFHAFLYLPSGVVCILFIYYTLKEFIEEDNINSKPFHSILLKSSLARMLFVSLIFIGISMIVIFKAVGIVAFIKEMLWRMKGNLGLVFLIDLLLMRIDIDNKVIAEKKQEIEEKLEQQSLSSMSAFGNENINNNLYIGNYSNPMEYDVYAKQYDYNLPYYINDMERINSLYSIPEDEFNERYINQQINVDVDFKPEENVNNHNQIIQSLDKTKASNFSQDNLSKHKISLKNKYKPYLVSKPIHSVNEVQQYFNENGEEYEVEAKSRTSNPLSVTTVRSQVSSYNSKIASFSPSLSSSPRTLISPTTIYSTGTNARRISPSYATVILNDQTTNHKK